MTKTHIGKIAEELQLEEARVEATALLLGEGGTVPFIARYRKEATGSLDEVAIAAIRDRLAQLAELDKRRDAILKSLKDQGKLTDVLSEQIGAAETLAVLEDIYLPFRPKRRTRATMAKEKGLEPLALELFLQEPMDVQTRAEEFVDSDKGVDSAEEALSGARDIIAEWVNEDQGARARLRLLFHEKGVLVSRILSGKEEEGAKYRDYFEWEEPLSSAPSHRILAMRRGEKEEFLTLRIAPPEEEAVSLLVSLFVKGENGASEQVKMAVQDGYKRLLSHAMETEMRMEAKKRADEKAIRVFAENLRQLLMTSPLGQKRVLALDPGFRTGCKLVCLDGQGKLLHTETIFPHLSEQKRVQAARSVISLCQRFEIQAVAIGNGTAGRETESFVKDLSLPKEIQVLMVNESGASIYSASEAAREEFPDQDLTVRGAVSIGRRLMDPLAELVKIDPKSIGVGQYQHDVDQTALKQGLDDVVTSCVNSVGVEVNTASRQLLTYVSGLGPQLARNIVDFRDEKGPFSSRTELREVPRLGPKAFEQAVGFLRIRGGGNPLDASAVHPESYAVVEAMARDLGCTVEDLMGKEELRRQIKKEKYITDKIGLPTLNDILSELARPGRDPRETYEAFSFAEGVNTLEDLKPGMRLPGVVTNVTAFGAFVDVGVHQDGLVHVSQLADRFVKDPGEVVKVQQKVMVTVLEVDYPRNRISLSMKEGGGISSGESKVPQGVVRKGGGGDKPKKTKPPATFNNPFAALLKK
jgi:protein Tex